MRWPRRRKPRSHDPSMAIDWSAFGEPDARFTKWMEHHRTHEPDCESCTESCPKPDNPQVKSITTVGGSQAWKARMLAARREALANRIDHGIRAALADATETIPNPNAQETTMTTPAFEPYDELDQEAHNYLTGAPAPTARSLVAILNDDRLDARRVANLVRDVRDAELPGYTTQIGTVKIAKCDSRGVTNGERAEYQRGLREGRLDNTVVRAEVVGSSEWLRDLADRLQQHNADRGSSETLVAEHCAETPYLIREYADEVERDERRAAADTRDRERVTAMLREQVTYAYSSTTDTVTRGTPFSDLPAKLQDAMVDDALELYRAGREDTVAAWQPANGGGGSTPGGQGGAHHA